MIDGNPVFPQPDERIGRALQVVRAQREFFDTFVAYVHGILYRILGSNREIEDLVQESFLQIFRSLVRFRGEAQLKTWISRITVRVAFAFLKRRKAPLVSLDAIPAPSSA